MSDKKTIYAFTYPEYKGLLKIGETHRTVKERMKRNILMPSEYKVELEVSCDVSDKEVHKELEKMGVRHVNGEWYECTKEDVLRALLRIKGFSTFRSGISGEIPLNELEALMQEGQKIANKFKLVNNLEQLIEITRIYKFLNKDDFQKVEQLFNILNSLNSSQRDFILKCIKSDDANKTLSKMNELLEEAKRTFDKAEQICNKNKCSDLLTFISKVEECDQYLKDKDQIEKEITKIKEEWNKLGVHNKNEFYCLLKRLKDERRESNKRVLCKLANNKKAILSDEEVFRFGKYCGYKIKDIVAQDKAYIDWLINNSIDTLRKIYFIVDEYEKETGKKKANMYQDEVEELEVEENQIIKGFVKDYSYDPEELEENK